MLNKKFRFFLAYNTPGHPWLSTKNFTPIGPAVWPAIHNICCLEISSPEILQFVNNVVLIEFFSSKKSSRFSFFVNDITLEMWS